MAAVSQVQQFSNLIPPGTPIAAPALYPMELLALDVAWIEWEVPSGTRGEVGFWIGSHGQPVIPFSSGPAQWIVTDGRAAHWDFEDLPDSGDWQMAGYNLGVNPHTVYVRFGLAVPAAAAPGGINLFPAAVLSSG